MGLRRSLFPGLVGLLAPIALARCTGADFSAGAGGDASDATTTGPDAKGQDAAVDSAAPRDGGRRDAHERDAREPDSTSADAPARDSTPSDAPAGDTTSGDAAPEAATDGPVVQDGNPSTDARPPRDAETDARHPKDTGADSTPEKDAGTDSNREKDAEIDTNPPEDASVDSNPEKDAEIDALPPEDATIDATLDANPEDAGCPKLQPDASFVYVASTAGPGGTGATVECPLQTIVAGVTAAAKVVSSSNPVTVEVGPGPYTEVNLSVPPYVTVNGTSSHAATSISGTSTANCGDGTTTTGAHCAVFVERGGTFQGIAVISSDGDGIVGATAAEDGLGSPTIANVEVSKITGHGIVALGGLELGPNVTVQTSTYDGVLSTGAGTLHIHGGGNVFSSNKNNGVNVTGTARLWIEEATTVDSNTWNGIRLGGTPAPQGDASTSAVHTIRAVTATGNGANGIAVFAVTGAQGVYLRNSVLNGNKGASFYYDYSTNTALAVSQLDLGTAADPGVNTFGIAIVTSGAGNSGAGLFLCHAPAASASQLAYEDGWSTCSTGPTVGTVPLADGGTECGALTNNYFDIVIGSASGHDPVDASDCQVGK